MMMGVWEVVSLIARELMLISAVQEGPLLRLQCVFVLLDLVLQGLCVCRLVGMGKWLEMKDVMMGI